MVADDTEQKPETTEEAKLEPKPKAEDDVSRLRSSYDKKLAASSKDMAALKQQIEEAQAEIAGFRSREDEISARAEAAKFAEDPEKALPRLEQALEETNKLRKQLAEAEAKAAVYGDKGLDYAAKYRVARIFLGDKAEDVEKLAARLQVAQSESELESLAEQLVTDLQGLQELAKAVKSSDDTIDSGVPSTGARSVVAEIKAAGTDPYSPEAQAKWALEREKLRARARGK